MMGKSHLITGCCALAHLYVAGTLALCSEIPAVKAAWDEVAVRLGVDGLPGVTSWSEQVSVIGVVLFLMAFFFRVLFPDADHPSSILGKFMYIPFGHRTWLHAVYFYIIAAVAGWFVHPVFLWFAFGAFVHLFWDSFSWTGNCWFYKLLSDYRRLSNDIKIKKGSHLVLYKTGQWTEYLLLFLIVVVTVWLVIAVRKG